MNKEVALQRYKDVLRNDVINNSEGDFLATHVPMKNLYVTDHAEVTEVDKRHPFDEEAVFDMFFSESEEDQFVLVKGPSGAGKSHLIRWFHFMLDIHKAENNVILFLRRADNTLKGTIRQLIELPEVKNLPNKDLYKKLASASVTVPELELKNTIYYTFVNLIESDDGKAGEGEERLISNVDRKHLIALLQNSSFKDRLMEDGGPIDRIYSKFAENKTQDVNDEAAGFKDEDFEIDSYFREELINVGADEKARKIADKLVDNAEYVQKIVNYINFFVEKVIQRCAGLEPGDLRNVIEEIRQELFKQGRVLTILIEDITAASGVDDSLLDALLTNKAGYKDRNLCRINSIVGTTDGYYVDKFRINTKRRIEKFINVPDDMFSGNSNGLIEFFARYLNTISIEKTVIDHWVDGKAQSDLYPVHEVTLGNGWGEYKLGDKVLNLFPFTKHAIEFLYKKQDINNRNPRAIMQDILKPYIEDAIEKNIKDYPQKRNSLEGLDTSLQSDIYKRNDLDDNTKIRLVQFMYIWGDGTSNSYTKKDTKYIAGIPTFVYEELNLPLIDGKEVKQPETQHDNTIDSDPVVEAPKPQQPEKIQKENEQVALALKEVDKWIENKDYKLNLGATTKSVRVLNDARKNINAYLYGVIDWASEGVPIDAMDKIKDKFLVAFDRQTMKSEAVVTLSASIESRMIIESFVRWSEVGKKSWNFPGSTDYLYRVQKWTESIKPIIVDSVTHYAGKEIDYFSFATAAEFYRLILNGYCKNFQSPENFSPELLLHENKAPEEENGHSRSWNDLMRIANGSDGKDNRNCVLQYFNLPQGTAINSTNYEYDYVAFNKAVRKVINTGLRYTDDDLQLDDPVKKRRVISEHLKKILDRINTVVEDEKKAINNKLDVLKKLIDLDDLEDEDDIKDIISDIKKFYTQAQNSHMSVGTHYDSTIINSCGKNAGTIISAIKNAVQIDETTDNIEALIKISRDPLKSINNFVSLLTLADNDVKKAKEEIENRSAGKIAGEEDASDYSSEKSTLVRCKSIIEEVESKNAD